MTAKANSAATSAMASAWARLSPAWRPFANVATAELPLPRLMRLALFQVTVGMATVLLIGTLNRVLIVELGVPAWLVAFMVALPLVFAPFRTLIGFRSDTHVSALGLRRVPYLWFGTLMQFGGLSIMPFGLILLSGDSRGPPIVGRLGAAAAFLLTGAGMQTAQTAGLALATDLAAPANRPRVVAMMYAMLLLGMVGAGLAFGQLLGRFSELRLIQVVQGAAVLTIALNVLALWQQEPRRPNRPVLAGASFTRTWTEFLSRPGARRFLWTVALGTAAFNMQDIILEPYGGEVLHLSVGATTTLTAVLALGMLVAFLIAARLLDRGVEACRVAGYGVLIGIFAFSAVILSAPLEAPFLFRLGGACIGLGAGLFAVATLAEAMRYERTGDSGLALGAWGAVQALGAGVAIALGGGLRDVVAGAASAGSLGPALATSAAGYGFVYLLEIVLLFVTLAAIGPLIGVNDADKGADASPGPTGGALVRS
jgi:MFS transporter, BCD family, chlorophyll transporter